MAWAIQRRRGGRLERRLATAAGPDSGRAAVAFQACSRAWRKSTGGSAPAARAWPKGGAGRPAGKGGGPSPGWSWARGSVRARFSLKKAICRATACAWVWNAPGGSGQGLTAGKRSAPRPGITLSRARSTPRARNRLPGPVFRCPDGPRRGTVPGCALVEPGSVAARGGQDVSGWPSPDPGMPHPGPRDGASCRAWSWCRRIWWAWAWRACRKGRLDHGWELRAGRRGPAFRRAAEASNPANTWPTASRKPRIRAIHRRLSVHGAVRMPAP